MVRVPLFSREGPVLAEGHEPGFQMPYKDKGEKRIWIGTSYIHPRNASDDELEAEHRKQEIPLWKLWKEVQHHVSGKLEQPEAHRVECFNPHTHDLQVLIRVQVPFVLEDIVRRNAP